MALIEDIKKIFKDKPVRILIAVFVISGFIALISIILSVIINNINKKKDCKTDGHIQYPDYNNICGPNCENYNMNVCPTKDINDETIGINCVPLCPPFSTYDLNTCKCVPDCTIHGDQWHNEPKYIFDGNEFNWSCRQNCNVDDVTCGMKTWCNTNNERAMCTYSLNKPDYCPSNTFKLCEDGKICISDKCEYPTCSNEEVVWIGKQNNITCENIDPSYTKELYTDVKNKNNIMAYICTKNETDENGNVTKKITGLKGGNLCTKPNKFYKKEENIQVQITDNMTDIDRGVGACIDDDTDTNTIVGINNNIQCPNIKNNPNYCRNNDEICDNGWQIKQIENGVSKCIPVSDDSTSVYQDIKQLFTTSTDNDRDVNSYIQTSGICCPGGAASTDGLCCYGTIYNDSSGSLCLNGPMESEYDTYSLDYQYYKPFFVNANLDNFNSNITKDEFFEKEFTQNDVDKLNTEMQRFQNGNSSFMSSYGSTFDILKPVSNVKFVLGENKKIYLGCGDYGNNELYQITALTSDNTGKKLYICDKTESPRYTVENSFWNPGKYIYNNGDFGLACYKKTDSKENKYWYNEDKTAQYYGYYTQTFSYTPGTVSFDENDTYKCHKLFNTSINNGLAEVPNVANILEVTTISDVDKIDGDKIITCQVEFKCNEQLSTEDVMSTTDANYTLSRVPGKFNKLHPDYNTTPDRAELTTANKQPVSKIIPNKDTLAQNFTIEDVQSQTIKPGFEHYNNQDLFSASVDCNGFKPIKHNKTILLSNGKIIYDNKKQTFNGIHICNDVKGTYQSSLYHNCYYDGIHNNNYTTFAIDVNDTISNNIK